MAVSLKDISRVTNINTCSISQVLNNHPKAMTLRPETRAKIIAAAKELGYCKNEMAASISGKNSKILAFVTQPMGSIEYTGLIQNGILNTVGGRGYTTIVYRLENMSQEEIITKIIGWRVAGVVFHVPRKQTVAEITAALDKNSIHYGFVNLSNPDGIGVTSNDRQGVADAVGYLKEKGHKRIALARIAVNGKIEYDVRRIQGYHDGLAEFFPQQEEIIFNIPSPEKENSEDFLQQTVTEIIRNKIDGIICTGDSIAAKLSNTALSMNYRVPDDFSVIGFGNSVISGAVFPPLTTIYQNFEAMGEAVVNCLIDIVEKKSAIKKFDIMQPTSILERKSVKDFFTDKNEKIV